MKLHNEVLIHVAAYAELILDHGWHPERLVFDPFFGNDALDIWGFADGPHGRPWREGDIVLAAEAKARIGGTDGLSSLVKAFQRLYTDRSASVSSGQRRKWEELLRLTRRHPIQLLLAADGARWWFSASQDEDKLVLEPYELTSGP